MEDEHFSLSWNNFNSNLSTGFHECLCQGDLVDVTLAAEGQLVKAHRLILSISSPYFRKMFTEMPANQHAFVFMKDVSHAALKDLIQFMYCGEVNVKQDALPAFIATAKALRIKGLTDKDDGQKQKTITLPAPKNTTTSTVPLKHQQQSSQVKKVVLARAAKSTRPTTQYKNEATSSSDNEIVHLQSMPSLKRSATKALNPLNVFSTKRSKVTSDPLGLADAPQKCNKTLELNQKNDLTEYDQDDTNYDDAYEELEKYNESYFTEDDVAVKPERSSKNPFSIEEGRSEHGVMIAPDIEIKEEEIDSDDEYKDYTPSYFDSYQDMDDSNLTNNEIVSDVLKRVVHVQPKRNSLNSNLSEVIPIEQRVVGHMEGSFYCYGGYRYYRDGMNYDRKTQKQKVYWRCCAYKRNKCRSRLHTTEDGIVLRVSQSHLADCKEMYPSERFKKEAVHKFDQH